MYNLPSPMAQRVTNLHAKKKNPACNAGDTGDQGSFSGLGISPGEENGNPLEYSCLENSMDREPRGVQSGSQRVRYD